MAKYKPEKYPYLIEVVLEGPTQPSAVEVTNLR